MATYTVVFTPDNREVQVASGSTILEAAQQAGVFINSLCGGQGLCGACRVQVTEGTARADKNAIGFFSGEEIRNGYVLACQTRVEDNLKVFVPAEARLELEKIVTEATLVEYSSPEKVSLRKLPRDPVSLFSPLVTKTYLQLPEPTKDDNISDMDRVMRGLRDRLTYPTFEVSLACLQDLADKLRRGAWKITVTVARRDGRGRIVQIEEGDTTHHCYGLAVDVGTTTVVVQLVDLKTGKVLGVEANHNLQSRYGEDVISRMIFACGRGSLQPLHQAVTANVNILTGALAREKGIDLVDITCMVAAGNTTMSHFLLGLMPCSVRLAPYVPTTTVYPQVLAREIGIGINPNGVVEVLPSIASYVGGDTVAGVLACGMANMPEPQCLIDVGTNGEIAIGNNEWIVCCSASAGPAFEGGGSKWGMRAAKGAIETVEIAHDRVHYETIGKAKPRGICGSGLIDCIYELVRNKLVGRDGTFNISTGDKRIVIGEEGLEYILAWPEETESGKPLTIAQNDIRNLMRSKAAIFAAVKSLADYIGVSFKQLDRIYLAGGFGSSLNISKAIGIGLLPDIDTDRIQYIGNSSLMGARMVLLSASAMDAALDVARKLTNIELSTYPPFMDEFVAALFLPHTHDSLFPSVLY